MFSYLSPTRRSLALLVAAALAGLAPRGFAGPTSPQVVAGQASFAQQGNVFSITSTPNTIINWASFSVNQGEVARFIQQNSSSAVLNRITGQDPTRILGALQSNGKVFLINPNGVLFGAGAQVDVNGLVASSLNISNADFLANKLHFSGAAGAGAVSNQGAITTPSGGQVFLIAPNVGNSGIIQSPQGEVILAAGHSVQLADSGNPDLHVVVSAPAEQALNLGQVIAQGGRIGIYGALINQRGAVSADSAVLGANGKIVFKSSGTTTLAAGSRSSANGVTGGSVEVLGPSVSLEGDARIDASGTNGGGTVLVGGGVHGLDASVPNAQTVSVSPGAVIAADAVASGKGGTVAIWSDRSTRMFGSISARGGANGGDGGFIETSGHTLAVDGARIDTRAQGTGATGQWLLDPYDIDVVDTGGSLSLGDAASSAAGPQSGVSTINAALLSGATSNVTLQASHDITFSSAVNIAASGVGLDAQAGNAMTVSAPITTHGGALTLQAGGAGLTTLAALDAGSGTVSLRADSMRLGAAVSGSAVTLAPFSSAQRIALGEAGGAGTLGLLQSDLNQLNAGMVTIAGNNGGGDFAISGAVRFPDAIRDLTLSTHGALQINGALSLTADGVGNLLLNSYLPVSQAAGQGISGPQLLTVIAPSVNLAGANHVGAVSGSATAGDFIVNSGAKLVVGGSGVAQGITATGTIGLTSTSPDGIDQNAGAILTAQHLQLQSSGPVTLAEANAVGSVTGSLDAAISAPAGGLVLNNTGSLEVDALSTHGRDISLSGNHLNVEGAVNAGAGAVILAADNLSLNGQVSAGAVALRTFSADRAIAVGTGCQDDACLDIDSLRNVVANSVAVGSADAGAISVGLLSADANTLNSATRTLALLSGRGVMQTAGSSIAVRDLAVSAVGSLQLNDGNQYSNIAASLRSDGASLTLSNSGDVTVAHLGSSALGYDIAGLSNPGGAIVLRSGGAITQGAGAPIVARALTVSAVDGIGSPAAPLQTQVSVLDASDTRPGGSPLISIRNNADAPGPLSLVNALQSGPGNSSGGGISIENTGAFEVPAGATVSSSRGDISLVAHSPLTIAGTVTSAGGNISLEAGATGSAADVLTIAGTAQVTAAQGNIALKAGSSIDIDGAAQVAAPHGMVTQLPMQNAPTPPTPPTPPTGPTLNQCIANPAMPGCAAVLPPILACIANPATPGCAAVLPPILACIVNPTTPGCTAVLPPLSACIAHPAMNGCAAVLPPLSACIANPATNGCAAVLPPLSACVANPTMNGCVAVLPPLSACVANPAMNGCAAVLPPLSACVANPATNGCSAVLPPLSACVANPAMNGCAAVLPPLSACVANPAMNGCAAVLPPLSACVANPATNGCSAVLPPLSACVANPAMNGCAAVLPPLAACVANPAAQGCSAVLPTLSACSVDPGTAGCAAVLPTLSQCTASPGLQGCGSVLPSLGQCVSNPAAAGCPVVLPTLAQCVANPAASGCSAILPTLSACVANPLAAGCAAVLPTLAQCAASPALPGCVAVTAPSNPSTPVITPGGASQDQCALTPSLALCQVLTPPTQSTPVKPVTTAQNAVVALIPTAPGGSAAQPADGGSGSGGTSNSSGSGSGSVKASPNNGASKNDTAKKMYCN